MPAHAASGTVAGDPTCPHGFNTYTWASDLCYKGAANAFQITAYHTGFVSPTTFQPNQTKSKVTMYTGSGCGDYLEAGVMDSQVAPAGYSNYVEVRLPGHSPAQSFYSGSPTATIFYYQGTSVFGASFSNPPNPNNDVASYNFSPDQKGCIEEAGEFVWSAISNNDAGWNALSAQTSILVQLIGGGSVTTFGNYVIDNPCNLFPTYNCMNGQFTNSSTGWNAAVG